LAYDVVALDAGGESRLAGVALSMDDQLELVQIATRRSLTVLGSLPDYWGGDVRTLRDSEISTLCSELDRVIADVGENADLAETIQAIRQVALLALEREGMLSFVPD
jgi:hypothetical protein